MGRRKKVKVPSKNFCVVCGRISNDKKYFGDNWTNEFFACNKCKMGWCSKCMAQVSGRSPNKNFRLGRKGKVNCPDCGKAVPMIRLPENLPFEQSKSSSSSQGVSSGQAQPTQGSKEPEEHKFCDFCGEKMVKVAKFCQTCGAAQK